MLVDINLTNSSLSSRKKMELRRFEDADAVAVSEFINNWLWSYRPILEHDEFFLRAKRIEILASITGVPFYIKMVSVNQTKNI